LCTKSTTAYILNVRFNARTDKKITEICSYLRNKKSKKGIEYLDGKLAEYYTQTQKSYQLCGIAAEN